MKKIIKFVPLLFSQKKTQLVFTSPKGIFIKLEELEQSYRLQLKNTENKITELQAQKKNLKMNVYP